MKNYFYILYAIFIFYQCNYSYDLIGYDDPTITNAPQVICSASITPNGCFMMCLMESDFVEVEESLLIYIGTDPGSKGASSIDLVFPGSRELLFKGKTDEHWRRKKVYEIANYYWVISDTTIVNRDDILDIELMQVKTYPHIESKQRVCEKDITPELIRNVFRSLRLAGFQAGIPGGIVTPEFLEAMELYQIKYNLPLCEFNFETMQHMGIEGF